jgi:TRAP transporter 4TM/12TM fusion protein
MIFVISTMTTQSEANLKDSKPYQEKKRNLTGITRNVAFVIAVGFALFQLYTAFFGVFPHMQQRSIHISFVLALVFILYPATSKSSRAYVPWYDWIIAFTAAFCTVYIFLSYDNIALRGGVIYKYELVFAAIFTVIVFEAGRRVLGYPLPVFCFMFLLFGRFGRSMPGPIQHFGLSVPRILEELYMTTNAFFGQVAGVSATYIYLFVLFGAFLTSTKTSEFFNNIAMALTGHYKGGPAKIAVISSALMGTISGSTSANVATTGAFTIPLMKQIGYHPYFAAAVEAAASTGGQIMPPVMGAAAFIIADSLGVKYTQVLLAAIVPALLYFWGIWCSLSLEASKLGLKGLPKETLPKVKEVLLSSGYKAIPLFVIIFCLMSGYNPLYSGCWGIIACILLSFVKKSDRLTIEIFFKTLEDGSKSALSVAVACTIVGVVIGMLGATGVALRVLSSGEIIAWISKEAVTNDDSR